MYLNECMMITAVFQEYDRSNTKNIAVNEDMSFF